jgi:hypothetical protein
MLLCLSACTTTSSGGAGSQAGSQAGSEIGSQVGYVPVSCPMAADTSLKITNAKSHMEGVAAEYAWLRRNLPGWTRDGQALMPGPRGRTFDVLFLVKGKQKKTVCFEITDFWKFLES